MAVKECRKCRIERYFSDDSRELCNRCEQVVKKQRDRFNRAKAHYDRLRRAGKLHFRFALIDLRWRRKLSAVQIAEILGETIEVIEYELDIARQDAR